MTQPRRPARPEQQTRAVQPVQPSAAWQPAEPAPVGDPVYVEQPYPYPPYPDAYAYPPPYPAAYAYPQAPYGSVAYPYAPTPAPDRVAPAALGYGLLAAAVLMVAAAFMPWAQVFGVSVNGTDGTGDGTWTLFLGGVIGAMGIAIALARGRLWASAVACVAAGFALLTAVKDLSDVRSFADDHNLDPSAVAVGAGLWLTLVAGLCAAALSVFAITRRRERRSP